MGGSGIGLVYGFISGGRIAGNDNKTGIYIPPHIDPAGKQQSARAIISIYINKKRHNEPERFKVTFFGKLADVAAKFGPGKELGAMLELNSYRGKVYDPISRQPVTLNGQILTSEQVGMVVRDLTIGDDGNKHIAWEIANGARPVNWNIAGHQDAVTWQNMCTAKNATVYVSGDVYGCCRVIIPAGQIIQPQPQNQNLGAAVAGAVDLGAQAQTAPATTAPVGAPVGAPATGVAATVVAKV